MISQQIRSLAPEQDPLRMGMGWRKEDLSKPQIMVESTFGDSHPGSAHLLALVEETVSAVAQSGGPVFCHGYLRRHGPGPRWHELLPGQPGSPC